jgi:hypothetical protein
MAVLAHAGRGIAQAARRPRLVLLLWLLNSTLAALAVLPAAIGLARSLAYAPAGDALRDGFSVGLTAEMARDAASAVSAEPIAFASAALLAILIGPFVAAGVVETLGSADTRSLAHRFGRGAGHFGGRFLRAGIAAAALAMVGAALFAAPWLAIRHRLDEVTQAYTRGWLGLVGGGFATLAVLLALLALDYARLEIARRDGRRPMRLVWRSLLFVLAHPLRTLGLWLANALALGVALLLYLALSRLLPATSWITVAVMVAGQQAFSLTRAGLRVALWSAERGLLDEVSPLAETPLAPTESVPPVDAL